jgi:hypothetical protein
MSLDWSTKKCAVPAAHGQQEAEERERLVFASQAVGLSTVTADNEHEWLVRLHVWHELGRGQLLGKNPLGVLERWLGLETNVEDRSREQWRHDAIEAAVGRGEFHADRALGVTA